jgi:hypothetical protein
MITRIFTPENLARIPELVAQGLSPGDIAAQLGCKSTSLITICSTKRISLRRPGEQRERGSGVKTLTKSSYRITPPSRPPPSPEFVPPAEPPTMPLRLSDSARRGLQFAAYRKGVSTAKFATLLLETIAADNLYAAVLDEAAA